MATMIEIEEAKGPVEPILASGKGVAFYEFGWRTANARYRKQYPFADNWYTERNGDSITLLVPKEDLPTWAMGYRIFQWINPDDDF